MLVDLGRLKYLLEKTALAGELEEGTGIEILPLFESGRAPLSLPIDADPRMAVRWVNAWEIRFTSGKGTFAYRASSIAEAVEVALSSGESWR